MPGRLEFEFGLKPRAFASRAEDAPMRILLMGDFSGHGQRSALAERRPHAIDIDNFAAVMARIEPRLSLAEGELSFSDLDDFHPDRLYRDLDLFEKLRQLRQRLLDHGSSEQAIAELRQAAPPAEPAQQTEDTRDDFERLLGSPASAGAPQSAGRAQAGSSVDRLIQSIVAPHIVSARDPQPFVDAIDASLAELMRRVLHHSEFQTLEALWRAAFWLVSSLETGETLKLYLLDVDKQSLASDLQDAPNGDLTASALYRRLVEHSAAPGGEPWSLLAGAYTFAANRDDLNLLAALGALASHAGGPFLAAADSAIMGCPSLLAAPEPRDWQADADFAQTWQALRRSAVAPWLGLALPRLLMRLPYGSKSDRIDSFDFEEMAAGRAHDDYLWANPAFACALLIARSFMFQGWDMAPGTELDIEDLPLHTYQEDGESRIQACAETFLSERQAEAIAEHGLMALLSYRNRNQARLWRFQSLAQPPGALAGAWRG